MKLPLLTTAARATFARTVFPIVRVHSVTLHRLIGTGFFLSTDGLFLTASHVAEEFIATGRDEMTHRLYAVLPSSDSKEPRGLVRFAQSIRTHKLAHVGAGRLAPPPEAGGAAVANDVTGTVETAIITPGTGIWTVGYPTTRIDCTPHRVPHFTHEFVVQRGTVLEYSPTGDSPGGPYPQYLTQMRTMGSASGGPVFTDDGRLFGLVAEGIDREDGEPDDVTYVASLAPLASRAK